MLYQVHSLTTEKLKELYMKESKKLIEGIDRLVSYNELNAIKRELAYIDAELSQRRFEGISKY
jgi:hypothetical protein